ncbi:hypothetical protein CEUSTIGMA_g12868.t1 [Chlamydomonas eustigma]|uniref:Uncharacterized protein n=1 Tax=Chlamydomonas eustigma TaxID=1157962 RepID=A0A250XR84_9CHLO|nr:hypothetical protein CEUSTIGMA_g12868.t1 [Chlamydomonas eustigma]|eukprot:GAX85452.1 hypothetical protein CEUSTIGMA_g12868.t1 [Chlamydomonas eustigma]
MAKGSRSNHKKAVRTQRRLNMKASWQEEADARRYQALAHALESDSIAPSKTIDSEAQKQPQVIDGRGREGLADKMETDSSVPSVKRRKGVKIKGILKPTKHNKKKTSALWASNFHKSKKGKQGFQ